MNKVLIVEDEIKLANILKKYLENAEYEVKVVHDGSEVISTINSFKPDLMLLDLMLPNVDGITICKEVRASNDLPIVMTTAKIEEIDRLLGLEVGADDYVCKPYSPKEVVARVKAILRRLNFTKPELDNGLVVNMDTHLVTYEGQNINLTHVEFCLLKTLSDHPGRVYHRESLINSIYEDDRYVSDRTIDSHIKKIRKKLSEVAPGVQFIHSIYGLGYKFEITPNDCNE